MTNQAPDAAAPARRPRRTPRWELVWQGDGEGQASIVSGGLESQGIRTRMYGYQPLPQAYPTAWARDNWAIYVPARDADRARGHLRETGEDANVMEGGDTLDGDQRFMLQLTVLGLFAVVVISLLGAIFSGWSP